MQNAVMLIGIILNVILPSSIVLNVVMLADMILNVILLSSIMLNEVMLTGLNIECHSAGYHYAVCCYADWINCYCHSAE